MTIIIYNCHIFIVQATGLLYTEDRTKLGCFILLYIVRTYLSDRERFFFVSRKFPILIDLNMHSHIKFPVLQLSVEWHLVE
jgi:hypothetical protein